LKKNCQQKNDAIIKKNFSQYVNFIKRKYSFFSPLYISIFNFEIYPKDMGKNEIERFLSHLAIDINVSISTQNQATSAILFLFRDVLHIEIDNKIQPVKARKKNPYQLC